ncbi:hypothetical protein TPA0910_42890 [Streptomyces hygroscopicus subsp. sporocinereus]|uniref:Uncharacterized protein n=1 Tax=Streptomyces hygroscopicus TaxID=1912 RepID=A0ABQ3U3M7_STRHY|nr:hypothetical protein TPA0910_42890 [Streptomyces hygroscopicus]
MQPAIAVADQRVVNALTAATIECSPGRSGSLSRVDWLGASLGAGPLTADGAVPAVFPRGAVCDVSEAGEVLASRTLSRGELEGEGYRVLPRERQPPPRL